MYLTLLADENWIDPHRISYSATLTASQICGKGKNKSLAVSKLEYVCSKLYVPEPYIRQVQSEISNFIWNGKKPKIKHDTLIGDYSDGGLRALDFNCKIKAHMGLWAKRMLENEPQNWKIIPNMYLKQIGGSRAIGLNFSKKSIPHELPEFYRNVLGVWAELSECNPNDDLDLILCQSLWNNRLI